LTFAQNAKATAVEEPALSEVEGIPIWLTKPLTHQEILTRILSACRAKKNPSGSSR